MLRHLRLSKLLLSSAGCEKQLDDAMTPGAKEAQLPATHSQKRPHRPGTPLPPQPQDTSGACKGTVLNPGETPEPCRPHVSVETTLNIILR